MCVSKCLLGSAVLWFVQIDFSHSYMKSQTCLINERVLEIYLPTILIFPKIKLVWHKKSKITVEVFSLLTRSRRPRGTLQ